MWWRLWSRRNWRRGGVVMRIECGGGERQKVARNFSPPSYCSSLLSSTSTRNATDGKESTSHHQF
jgi:hypothetical protein